MTFFSVRFIVFLLLLPGLKAWGTTFFPTPLEDRLKTASGVIWAVAADKSYKKLPDDSIVTDQKFSIIQASGLTPNQVLNKQRFSIILPGGKWNGMVRTVIGVPSFEKGEEVVLIIQKGKFGYQLANLAMSKFVVEHQRGKIKLVSEVFSEKEGVGNFSLEEFNDLVEKRFEQKMAPLNLDKYVYTDNGAHNKSKSENSAGVKRAVASTEGQEDHDNEKREGIPSLIMLIVLGVLAAVSSKMGRGKKL